MYDNNIASASKLPPMFIFPKEIVHIQYIHIHTQTIFTTQFLQKESSAASLLKDR
jgi:hypothetical protein